MVVNIRCSFPYCFQRQLKMSLEEVLLILPSHLDALTREALALTNHQLYDIVVAYNASTLFRCKRRLQYFGKQKRMRKEVVEVRGQFFEGAPDGPWQFDVPNRRRTVWVQMVQGQPRSLRVDLGVRDKHAQRCNRSFLGVALTQLFWDDNRPQLTYKQRKRLESFQITEFNSTDSGLASYHAWGYLMTLPIPVRPRFSKGEIAALLQKSCFKQQCSKQIHVCSAKTVSFMKTTLHCFHFTPCKCGRNQMPRLVRALLADACGLLTRKGNHVYTLDSNWFDLEIAERTRARAPRADHIPLAPNHATRSHPYHTL